MIVRVNKNWGINVKNIKDIGLDGDKIVITWLDDSINKYQADDENMASIYFNRLLDLMEDSIRKNGVK